ncbi:MAG: radical SAM protein [Ponticaulis sp.]|nr:radical SAM protein [Ponticaulis sp.]|tara:strand:+ start:17919 stop:19055 length:1137 start_codon:yes stop_codon:yes gene_type:complete
MRSEQKLPRSGRINARDLNTLTPGAARKGRGAVSNPDGRFEIHKTSEFDDGWENGFDGLDKASEASWHRETAKSIITRNQSPDISFDRSINPYRGCEHGCIYCFARPSHAYLGHSAGVDFERQLYFKQNAISLLKKEMSSRNYVPSPIALGVNTDAYQPEERRLRLTRGLIEVLAEFHHPVTMITKSGLIRRDIDLLAPMAELGLARVAISLTTLQPDLARKMEPRAASPALRLKTIEALSSAGIPTAIMTAPLIPGLNDMEIEALLEAGRNAGAERAGYVLLRLPHDLKDIFQEWLIRHYPDRAQRVINTLREMRGGLDYDADWQKRQKGEGPMAKLIASRFHKAAARLGYDQSKTPLRVDLFRKPEPDSRQTSFNF